MRVKAQSVVGKLKSFGLCNIVLSLLNISIVKLFHAAAV
jgi:hypothetical protein